MNKRLILVLSGALLAVQCAVGVNIAPNARAVDVFGPAPGATMELERQSPAYSQTQTADAQGVAHFNAVPFFPGAIDDPADVGRVNLHFSAKGYKDVPPWTGVRLPNRNQQVVLGNVIPYTNPSLQIVLLPRPVLTFTPLPRLMRDGQFISTDGEPWFALGVSSYNLLPLFINNDPTFTAVLDDLEGFNVVRVWTLGDVEFSAPRGGHFHLIPNETPSMFARFAQLVHISGAAPDFYDTLVPFVRALAARGKYVLFDGFTGASRNLPGRAAQQAHLDKLYAVARAETNVFVTVGNEYEQGDNQWCSSTAFTGDPNRPTVCKEDLSYPTDILISAGSVGSDKWATNYGLTTLQLTEYHSNDSPEWWRKMPHEPWQMSDEKKTPAMATENTKADDALGDWSEKDKQIAAARFYGAFQGCKLLNDGCFFHYRDGRMSRVMPPEVKTLALRAIDGANSIEGRCRRINSYQHRLELEGPGQSLWLRVYQQGNDAKCLAYVPN